MSETPEEDHDEEEDDESGECELCSYENPIDGLRELTIYAAEGRKFWLCTICGESYLNAALAPHFPEKDRTLWASIAWIANRLREDIAEGKAP